MTVIDFAVRQQLQAEWAKNSAYEQACNAGTEYEFISAKIEDLSNSDLLQRISDAVAEYFVRRTGA